MDEYRTGDSSSSNRPSSIECSLPCVCVCGDFVHGVNVKTAKRARKKQVGKDERVDEKKHHGKKRADIRLGSEGSRTLLARDSVQFDRPELTLALDMNVTYRLRVSNAALASHRSSMYLWINTHSLPKRRDSYGGAGPVRAGGKSMLPRSSTLFDKCLVWIGIQLLHLMGEKASPSCQWKEALDTDEREMGRLRQYQNQNHYHYHHTS